MHTFNPVDTVENVINLQWSSRMERQSDKQIVKNYLKESLLPIFCFVIEGNGSQ